MGTLAGILDALGLGGIVPLVEGIAPLIEASIPVVTSLMQSLSGSVAGGDSQAPTQPSAQSALEAFIGFLVDLVLRPLLDYGLPEMVRVVNTTASSLRRVLSFVGKDINTMIISIGQWLRGQIDNLAISAQWFNNPENPSGIYRIIRGLTLPFQSPSRPVSTSPPPAALKYYIPQPYSLSSHPLVTYPMVGGAL